MSEQKTCPVCGTPLEADAPAGMCPKCLLLAAVAKDSNRGSASEVRPTTISTGFAPPDPQELARLFPHLEIIELIGRGGMGAVYKARQPGLDRFVAVKILPPEVAADPAFAERFSREARALAKLSHQNIVSVFDFGQVDGQFYIMMEYVDGTNLRQLIETQSMQPAEALAIVPQICEALQFAHNEGIVHRDIKPENILIDRQGRVKIADFGLAKLLGKTPEAATLTAAHQVMGTLHYMAPEQMRGSGAVDHRADIYSLGVVFYEMLTGQLPIGRFEPPSKKVQVDVRLDEVVLRALENEPARRYQNAGEVKIDVTAITSTRGMSVPAGTASDQTVFRRLTVINLIVSGLWAATFSTLQLGYILGADWYFQRELPYDNLNVWFVIFSVWMMGGIAGWWYLLAKRPETPRSFSDFVRLAQSPDDRVKRIWKPVLVYAGICLLATIACWPLGDTARAIQMGLVFVSLPFATMTILRAAYVDRFPDDSQVQIPSAALNAALSESKADLDCAVAGRRLRNPMAALFVVGLAQLILSVVLASWTGVTLGRIHSTPQTPETTGEIDETGNGMTVTISPHEWWPYIHWFYTLLGVSIFSAVVGSLAMAAAVFGSRLQLERFVRIVCGLLCIPSPAWPFGLTAALVAFSVLGRPNVRAAFAAVDADDTVEPRPSILNRWSVWTALGIVMAILVVTASLIPWVRLNFFGITFTGIGIEHWHGIVVCVAGGLAAILVAAFATCGGSRLGQGLAECIGGVVATATAGYFVWEAAQPLQAETSATVTGDESLQDLGNEMADSFADIILDGMGQQSAFGSQAAIVCGVLLALVGAGQLLVPLFFTANKGGGELSIRVRGLGEDFIVMASISLLTAVGACLWLRFSPTAPLLGQQTRFTLQMMTATHAIYGAFILTAGLLMLNLRARLAVLLIATVVGIAIPAVLALNTIMEWGRMQLWQAIIPLWLGVPVAVWATRVLFQPNVRELFGLASTRVKETGT